MKKIVLLLFVSFLVYDVMLAQIHLSQRELTKEGIIKYQRFNDTVPRPLSQAIPVLKSLLNMKVGDSLHLMKTFTENGYSHQLYQQYYNGYKVERATYAIHAKNGAIETANGFFNRIDNVSLDIKIDKKKAFAIALKNIHAATYGWEDPFSENLYKSQSKDPNATLYPLDELVIFRDDSISHAYRLVYKLHVYAARPVSDNNIYVDAQSGNIVAKENLICLDNVGGTAATLYSGTQNITMDSYNVPVQYRLRETRTGPAGQAIIQTLNMQGANAYANAVDFSNNSTNWTADAALDVHWATEKVFDYWNNVRGRNSYDGQGGALFGYVHSDLVALGISSSNDNAAWIGALHLMVYGDGATYFKPVTSLDVIAHETGHGICQSVLNLPSNGEGGALNEGLSDIWGAVIENYAAPNKQTWRIGEDIMKDNKPCIRSLQNPKTDGDPNLSSTGGYPDTYGKTYWDVNLEPDPHTN